MTLPYLNIFADDTTAQRTAAIKRRLVLLERSPLFGQQRAYGRQGAAVPLTSTFVRYDIAAARVYVPESGARLRFSAVGKADYPGVEAGGLVWTIYNVYEATDAIYTPGVIQSFGDAVENYLGGNIRPLFNDMGLIEYRPNVVGDQTYAVTARYVTGSPSANIAGVSLNVEVV